MNVTIKQWVDALRSGDYNQGKKRLKTVDGGYCCLGVLCHLGGAEFSGEQRFNTVYFPNVNGEENSDVELLGVTKESLNAALKPPPDAVVCGVRWDFDPDCNYRFKVESSGEYGEFQSILALLNDKLFDFDQIADVIEAFCDVDATVDVNVR